MNNLLNFNFNGLPQGIVLLIGVLSFVFFLIGLVCALKNKELNDVSRFMWVFIMISLPFVGVILYLIFAPDSDITAPLVGEEKGTHTIDGNR